VFASPAYRRLWAARTVSQWGDVVQFVTVALLVLHLTGSGVGVSGVVLAEVVPLVVLAPLAGAVVDRLSRVRVMIAADLARVVLAGLLAAFHGQVAAVYAVAFGLSAGSAFFNPAAGSLLPGLVAGDQLVAANSGIWSSAVLSQVVLAPVAGILAATVGYGAAFAVNAVSFAASAALLAGLRRTETPRPAAASRLWTEGRRGFAAVRADRLLRALAVSQTLAALSAGATSALLVVLVRRGLHASTVGYGLALAAIGVGAFAGPLVLSKLRARGRHGGFVVGAYGLRGAVDLTLASINLLPAALGALVGYGLGTSTGNVSFSSLIQRRVPDETRGRVFSAFDLLWHAARLVSIAAGGAIADAYGIRTVYYAGGSLLLLAATAGLWGLRCQSGGDSPPGTG
jgi:MFS family permease